MRQFGIIRWGETTMHSVHAETREEADRKLGALGYTGFIIEILDVEAAPTSRRSSVPPGAKVETHWGKACEILEEGRREPIAKGGKGR